MKESEAISVVLDLANSTIEDWRLTDEQLANAQEAIEVVESMRCDQEGIEINPGHKHLIIGLAAHLMTKDYLLSHLKHAIERLEQSDPNLYYECDIIVQGMSAAKIEK